jgi:dienelactone hydrolase
MARTNKSEGTRWLASAEVGAEFEMPGTRKSWEKKRVEVRQCLWHLLGSLPARPKLPRVEILSRSHRGNYLLETFQFDNGAGATVPGYLMVPSTAVRGRKCPAILYCHWHGGEYHNGKEELFHKAHTPVGPGPTLARHGYVVLAIDAYCFGERSGQGPGGPMETGASEELSTSKFNLWVGRTLWGMILRDDLMALEYLLSRPEVDRNRVGVTGMSMGATRSWWLMALDERVRTSVAVACLTRYQNLIQHQGLARHGIYYFVPGMLNHFDTEAVVSLIAPRPILFLTGDKDAGSPIDGVRAIGATVRKAYKLYGQANQFESVIYPAVGHQYTRDMWERMMKWMDRHLKTMTNDQCRNPKEARILRRESVAMRWLLDRSRT